MHPSLNRPHSPPQTSSRSVLYLHYVLIILLMHFSTFHCMRCCWMWRPESWASFPGWYQTVEAAGFSSFLACCHGRGLPCIQICSVWDYFPWFVQMIGDFNVDVVSHGERDCTRLLDNDQIMSQVQWRNREFQFGGGWGGFSPFAKIFLSIPFSSHDSAWFPVFSSSPVHFLTLFVRCEIKFEVFRK